MKDEIDDETGRQGDTAKRKSPVSPRHRFSASFVLSDAAASDLDRENQRPSFEGARKRLLETTFTLRQM